jgi:hypothetical protein
MVYAVGLSAHLPHHSDSVKGEIILVKKTSNRQREKGGSVSLLYIVQV